MRGWRRKSGRPGKGGWHRRARPRVMAGGGLLLVFLFPTGCGGGIASPDIFVVQRSGTIPGASLTLVVNDGGTVRCDGGPPRPISDSQLVLARGIQEELKAQASRHLVLPGEARVRAWLLLARRRRHRPLQRQLGGAEPHHAGIARVRLAGLSAGLPQVFVRVGPAAVRRVYAGWEHMPPPQSLMVGSDAGSNAVLDRLDTL